MTLTNIEKAAKLMGYNDFAIADGDFNPYGNKADLMGLECELGIDLMWFDEEVFASLGDREELTFSAKFADHPDKFTARAHAVMAVVEQIYDAKFGKDGE